MRKVAPLCTFYCVDLKSGYVFSASYRLDALIKSRVYGASKRLFYALKVLNDQDKPSKKTISRAEEAMYHFFTGSREVKRFIPDFERNHGGSLLVVSPEEPIDDNYPIAYLSSPLEKPEDAEAVMAFVESEIVPHITGKLDSTKALH